MKMTKKQFKDIEARLIKMLKDNVITLENYNRECRMVKLIQIEG